MPNTSADALSQGKGEILRAWLNNLGISATSLGEGELMVQLANFGALEGSQGRQLSPSNAVAATGSRNTGSQTIVVASGTLQLTGIFLVKGMVISNVNFITGSTAGATLTHQWAGIYTPARVLAAVSADGTSTAMAANTQLTYALSAAYTVPTSGLYYVGLLVTNGATQPTFSGTSGANAAGNALVPILAGTSNTGLTTPQTVGTTATAITATADMIYFYLT